MKIFYVLALGALLCSPASAQWQTPKHSVPIGQGAAISGFGNAAPGTAGQPFLSNGPNADPSFQTSPFASLTLPNVFTHDQIFGSGRPWVDPTAYGAVCDGMTDSAPAFQQADTVAGLTGGAIYVPPCSSSYCIKTGPVILNSLGEVLFSTSRSTTISACGTDNSVVELSQPYQSVYNLTIYGKGAPTDTGTVGAITPAVLIRGTGGGCNDCFLDSLNIFGGSNCLSISPPAVNGEFFVWRSYISYCHGSLVYAQNAGGWFNRMKIDQAWPEGPPAIGTALNAWAATTSYARGAVVTSGGYMIQCSQAGTSGGSAPTLKNYGQTVTDGSAQWILAGLVGSAALQLDTGTSEIYGTDVDMTGATTYGVQMSNTLSGAPPQFFRCVDCISSQTASNAYYFQNGNDVYLTSNIVAGGWTPNSPAVIFNGNFSGQATITGGKYGIGSGFGVIFATGTNYTIQNTIVGATVQGIAIQVSNVIARGNVISSSGGTGVNINNSLSRVIVDGNICPNGASPCANSPTGMTNSSIINNF
jgi:hypothetical protein